MRKTKNEAAELKECVHLSFLENYTRIHVACEWGFFRCVFHTRAKKLQRYKLVRDIGASMLSRARCLWITIFLVLLLKWDERERELE